jgi:flagellar hook protein FlgE
MLRSLTTATSGLQVFQGKLDIIGNNIANVNTAGYKSARTDFADSFSQTLRQASGGVSGVQIGTGVSTSAVLNDFTQGAISPTGVNTDLAIEGDGYFVVRETVSGEMFYTRAGDFKLDQDGYLTTLTGQRVQGYSDAGLTTIGDIRIDITGAPTGSDPTALVKSFSIADDGTLKVSLSDGTPFTRGQILLQRFNDNQALVKRGNNLFSAGTEAGPIGGPTVPGSSGLGTIHQGALELSNVNLANEFSNMITAQRAFQATARIISTSDEMLQELVNLKR